MATYCGHSNAPAEYALKEEEEERERRSGVTPILPNAFGLLFYF